MLEQEIQSRKIKELEAEGYFVIKLISTNKNGIPDLIAIPPNSDVIFFEVKQRGLKPRPLQEAVMNSLVRHGVKCFIHDGTGDMPYEKKDNDTQLF